MKPCFERPRLGFVGGLRALVDPQNVDRMRPADRYETSTLILPGPEASPVLQ